MVSVELAQINEGYNMIQTTLENGLIVFSYSGEEYVYRTEAEFKARLERDKVQA